MKESTFRVFSQILLPDSSSRCLFGYFPDRFLSHGTLLGSTIEVAVWDIYVKERERALDKSKIPSAGRGPWKEVNRQEVHGYAGH
jgi:hypothetical protein